MLLIILDISNTLIFNSISVRKIITFCKRTRALYTPRSVIPKTNRHLIQIKCRLN